MKLSYKTISNVATAEYRAKGSRFIALAYPVNSTQQVKQIFSQLKKQHVKAVHVCYAYRIGELGEEFRVNDDGEPSGTAGLPILGQIDSLQLSNIVVMVIRYFGGVLLGVSGLIKAYKTVAKATLIQADIIEKAILKTVTINCDYADLNQVMKVIKKNQSQIIEQQLQLNCQLRVEIPLAEYAGFIKQFNKLCGILHLKLCLGGDG